MIKKPLMSQAKINFLRQNKSLAQYHAASKFKEDNHHKINKIFYQPP
jgi:hypothetical protein